jgi:hypothetical protein
MNIAPPNATDDVRRKYRLGSLSLFLTLLAFLVACVERSLRKIAALLLESRGPTPVHESIRYHNAATVLFGITVVLLLSSLVLAHLGRTVALRSVWWAPVALVLLIAFIYIENVFLF